MWLRLSACPFDLDMLIFYAQNRAAASKNMEEENTMDNQNPTPAQPCPWYDGRAEAVRKDDPAPRMEAEEGPARYTPREIYAYLDCKVWK